ncbi:MAG: proton-conducting transporter membrane subunit [Waddliaceae bacterium]
MNYNILLSSTALSLFFVSLSVLLWLFTTFYAIGYLEGSRNRSRFFGFFGLCITATTGIALAGNLFTMLIFYEFLTITTYPLVVHWGNRNSIKAGRVYLIYTILSGALLFFSMVWLSSITGPSHFAERGILSEIDQMYYPQLFVIFILFVIGFGVKSAIVPFHGWLPKAMVAPAPVSALLHAVAVVNAGAFGIIRLVYDIYGVEFCREFGLTWGLVIISSITILYGSIRALFQDDLKLRLAYSTISQISYILLGVAILNPVSAVGGIVQLFHQGIMKITLFLCAGILAHGCKITRVSQMNGIGLIMPWTMVAFTIGAFGMIGIAPTAGFITKWYLANGAVSAGELWIVLILVISTLLSAAYFFPILYAAWFKRPDTRTPVFANDWPNIRKKLIFPPVALAGVTLLMGLFAKLPFSPLSWAKFIVFLEYG